MMPGVDPSHSRIADIAQRYGFSPAAARTMFDAIVRGHGAMAQFNHPEFGGAGQWMRGGMTMVGDPYDAPLRERVTKLCADLATLVGRETHLLDMPRLVSAADPWWPRELGEPTSTGSQNDSRYAYFAGTHRLVIDDGQRTVIYDTEGRVITGVVSAQPMARSSFVFITREGVLDPAELAIVSDVVPLARSDHAPRSVHSDHAVNPVHLAHATNSAHPAGSTHAAHAPGPKPEHVTLATIEALAALHAKGILTAEEYHTKKRELLERI